MPLMKLKPVCATKEEAKDLNKTTLFCIKNLERVVFGLLAGK
jgi:hypothetical protein